MSTTQKRRLEESESVVEHDRDAPDAKRRRMEDGGLGATAATATSSESIETTQSPVSSDPLTPEDLSIRSVNKGKGVDRSGFQDVHPVTAELQRLRDALAEKTAVSILQRVFSLSVYSSISRLLKNFE